MAYIYAHYLMFAQDDDDLIPSQISHYLLSVPPNSNCYHPKYIIRFFSWFAGILSFPFIKDLSTNVISGRLFSDIKIWNYPHSACLFSSGPG